MRLSARLQVLEESDSDDSAASQDEEQYSDELSSSPSVPDASDIDFDLVYSLHTFLATVEGQASVSKGDSLTLLDSSNSYWYVGCARYFVWTSPHGIKVARARAQDAGRWLYPGREYRDSL